MTNGSACVWKYLKKIVENGPFRIVLIGSDVNGAKAIIDKISVRNILESNLTVSKADAVKQHFPAMSCR